MKLKFNPKAPKQGPGVYCLEDLRERCKINDEGCWVWAGCASQSRQDAIPCPTVGVPRGVMGNVKAMNMPAARCAWLMSGRRLTHGQIIWRRLGCDDRCINPEHRTAGTRADWGAWLRETGQFRGAPRRAAATSKGYIAQAIAPQTVQEIEGRIKAGEMLKDLAAEYGVSPQVMTRIKAGRHVHQRNRTVRAASIFSIGALSISVGGAA